MSKKILFPLTTSFLFSGSYVCAKYTTQDLGPLTTSFLRYAVSSVVLCLFLVYYKTSSLRVERKDLFKLFLLGLFGIVGYHFFFLLSLRYTEVANTAIINATSPIFTGTMAAIILNERLIAKNYAGIVIAFLGVLILLSRGNIDNIISVNINLGDAIMLLAVISWVIYALTVKQLIDKYTSFTLVFYATILGTFLLFFLAMSEDMFVQIRNVSKTSLVGVLYMGIFASAIAFLTYNFSIREIGPTKTSSFVYSLVPILVSVWSFLFFKQAITPVMLASMILIITGLNFVLRKKRSDN